MYLNTIYIKNRKHFQSDKTQIKKKTVKTTTKNLKIDTKNHKKIQSKRTQQCDGIITIAGNKQRL